MGWGHQKKCIVIQFASVKLQMSLKTLGECRVLVLGADAQAVLGREAGVHIVTVTLRVFTEPKERPFQRASSVLDQ